MLRKGQKAIITSPPETAYGSEGANDVVPPNATLIFEIEIIDFKEMYVKQKVSLIKAKNRSMDVYKAGVPT